MREWICRFMEESFRGRGLGTVVTQETIDFFDGLVNFVALVVTQKAEFRPAARWTNSWIYSSKCGGPPKPPDKRGLSRPKIPRAAPQRLGDLLKCFQCGIVLASVADFKAI